MTTLKKYRVTAPDGSVVIQEGKDPNDAIARLKAKAPTDFEKEARLIKSVTPAQAMLATPAGQFVAGAGDPFVGSAQLGTRTVPATINALSHMLPEVPVPEWMQFATPRGIARGAADLIGKTKDPVDRFVKQREENIRMGDVGIGNEGINPYRMGGNIVSAPAVASQGLLASSTPLQRIGSGAMLGGLFGMAAPVEDTDNYVSQKGMQTGTGVVLGATVPALIEGGRWAGRAATNLYQSITPSGQKVIAGKVLSETPDAQEIIPLLDSADEIIAGSKPTAAEAATKANNPYFSALQTDAARSSPKATKAYYQRNLDQMNARRAAVDSVAGTPQSLKAAENLRQSNWEKNTEAAFGEKLPFSKELRRMINSNPWLMYAADDATESMHAKISTGEKMTTTKYMHLMKKALDGFLAGNEPKVKYGRSVGLGGEKKGDILAARQQVINWLEQNSDDYAAARNQYRIDSGPINRMRVGQGFAKVLDPAVRDLDDIGTQRLTPYSNTLRDASGVITKAGGDPRFGGLDQIFKEAPEELDRLIKVGEDMARTAKHQELARTGAGTVQGNIAKEQMAQDVGASRAPNPFIRPLTFFNQLIDRIQGRGGPEIKETIALSMLDPKEVSAMMKRAMLSKATQAKVMEALARVEAAAIPASVYGDPQEKLVRAKAIYDIITRGWTGGH